MNTALRAIVTISCVMVLCAVCMPVTMGQQPIEPPKQNPAVIQYNGDMSNMLANLPSVYGRTIGFEVDPRQPRSVVQFYLKQPTLADVLNAITRSAPMYRWSESGESVEVVPLSGGSPFLDTKISSFRVDYADAAEAINQLLNLQEVQTSMNTLRLHYRTPQNDQSAGVDTRMSFVVQDVTLRQVLNRIAIENGSRFWVFKRNSAGIFSISTMPIRG